MSFKDFFYLSGICLAYFMAAAITAAALYFMIVVLFVCF